MELRAPKGTKDVVPQESYKWHYIENAIRSVCAAFGYREVRTPVFEHTELFLRGVGDTTDIVQKEMYTFLDKAGRSLTLKPEGTASVVRQFIENKLFADPQPTKMYYLNFPVFRYEKPQAGRLREHHQFGVEVFGAPNASADAEIIAVALALYKRLGVVDLALNINSIGCPACRPAYNEALKAYFAEHLESMCENCRTRFDKNPLRLLDCKEEKCKTFTSKAPVIIEHLCDDCSSHFRQLQEYLQALRITYSINPYIVRGLDYYTKTVFELISTNIGAQGTVCGGGRYDKLIAELGGSDLPGVGFGMGMERLLMVMEGQGLCIPKPSQFDVYVCTMGEEPKLAGFALAGELRLNNIKTECDHANRSMKAQFKYADKLGCRYVAIIGGDEYAAGVVKLKDMISGEETPVAMGECVKRLKEVLSE